ncbi:MAG: ATP-binding cassette domain-containing protein [bacterium]|nr:ATP-binding cassette domain-containing protein [Myxococcales bacterium]
MIEVRHLVKSFHRPERVVAVDDVGFSCAPGEIVGLLGPNGAGKTTTLRILATLLVPDAGTATVAGHDVVRAPDAVRRSIGYLSASTGLYPRLTARETLVYFAELHEVDAPAKRADALIERFEIGAFAHVRCDRLSTGMKQKVSIARAIVHDPPVLIFDEPTLGLDVLVAQTLLAFIEERRAAGRTVLFSTHVMREAERLCDRIAIIHQGRILAEDTLAGLQAKTGEAELEQVFVRLVEGAAAP